MSQKNLWPHNNIGMNCENFFVDVHNHKDLSPKNSTFIYIPVLVADLVGTKGSSDGSRIFCKGG